MALSSQLASRIRRRLRSKLTRFRHRAGWSTLETGPVGLATDFRHPIDARHKARLIARYCSEFAAAAQRELEQAQRLLRHEFDLLGHPMQYDRAIAWSRDPVSGRDWSNGYSAAIPYRGADRLGDIKLPWELNKHQYFFTLGKAAWLTGEPIYAREIVEQIDAWIGANPCHSGIHWISALETGTRVISWILTYPFYADACGPAARERLLRSIAQHLLFVEQNLSVDAHPNTHLAGEAAILAVGGLFIDCKHSERWLRLGLQHLEEQIHRQVRPDGVHAEQSIAYHRFFLDQYYLVHAFLRTHGRSFSATTLERMERMTQFLMDVMHPDGSVPTFGDCDEARGIWCRADAPSDYRSLLALGVANFGRGDFKMAARAATEELLWLHGEDALDRFATASARAPQHLSAAYPDAGYYVMRSGWDENAAVLAFDCGPLGHGAAGHGHADALSLQLFARGCHFLGDPGTYSYNLDYDCRDRFRSTRAHNTISIDDLDQSVGRDRMSWATQANARCRRWLCTAWFDLVEGEHDGYGRLEHPVTHGRAVIFIKPDVWVIFDRLTGSGEHRFQSRLHPRPDCTVTTAASGSAMTLSSQSGARLDFSLVGGLGTDDAPSLETIEDWYSESYGKKVPATSIAITGAMRGATALATALSSSPNVAVNVGTTDGMLTINVTRAGRRAEQLLCRIAGDGPVRSDDLLFDGDVLFRQNSASDAGAVWAADFRTIEIRDQLELRTQSRIKSLLLNGGSCEVTCEDAATGDPQIKAAQNIAVAIHRP